ncbi:MAG: spore coat protein CotJB [Acutalibacteraceae bacterium]
MNDRQLLMRRLSAAQFAAWELKMFLDTHPNDERALSRMKTYQAKANELRAEYESKYGPLTTGADFTDSDWDWVNDPWPWEIKEDSDNVQL